MDLHLLERNVCREPLKAEFVLFADDSSYAGPLISTTISSWDDTDSWSLSPSSPKTVCKN